jgi:hypothetical protein
VLLDVAEERLQPVSARRVGFGGAGHQRGGGHARADLGRHPRRRFAERRLEGLQQHTAPVALGREQALPVRTLHRSDGHPAPTRAPLAVTQRHAGVKARGIEILTPEIVRAAPEERHSATRANRQRGELEALLHVGAVAVAVGHGRRRLQHLAFITHQAERDPLGHVGLEVVLAQVVVERHQVPLGAVQHGGCSHHAGRLEHQHALRAGQVQPHAADPLPMLHRDARPCAGRDGRQQLSRVVTRLRVVRGERHHARQERARLFAQHLASGIQLEAKHSLSTGRPRLTMFPGLPGDDVQRGPRPGFVGDQAGCAQVTLRGLRQQGHPSSVPPRASGEQVRGPTGTAGGGGPSSPL